MTPAQTPTDRPFANTFVVPNGRDQPPSLLVFGPDIDGTARKKKPHKKSRLGCIRCKKRRVKCDEAYPCGNCVKRKETCVRQQRPTSFSRDTDGLESPSTSSLPGEMDWSPLPEPDDDGPINLMHMELLHHFERHTISTLCFEEIWPTLLQLAFQSQQHTYLVNAVLSFAAAHLAYLSPNEPRYHHANYSLLDKALHGYREALSSPITAENCDALLGTAVLIHQLMWCDLSFMEGQTPSPENEGQQPRQFLDLSADRLYWLSTGVRQIYFMAWPLFQKPQSVFRGVAVLQPCVLLDEVVEERGLNWQRFLRGFMDLYDSPRYQGGSSAFPHPYPHTTATTSTLVSHEYGSHGQTNVLTLHQASSSLLSTPYNSGTPTTATTTTSSITHSNANSDWGADESMLSAEQQQLQCNITDTTDTGFQPLMDPDGHKATALWNSYKMGEAYAGSTGGSRNKELERAAYERLTTRLSLAMAYLTHYDSTNNNNTEVLGCPATTTSRQQQQQHSRSLSTSTPSPREQPLSQTELMRFVLTLSMHCFGPVLPLIAEGDSRMLVVLFHIYRAVGALLPTDKHWWCRRRVVVMEEAIGAELRARGVAVCLRGAGDVV